MLPYNEHNEVIVRIWRRRNPNEMGHVSLETFSGEHLCETKKDKEKIAQFGFYASFWSDKTSGLIKSIVPNSPKHNSFSDDTHPKEGYGRSPDAKFRIRQLDIEAIETFYRDFREKEFSWHVLSSLPDYLPIRLLNRIFNKMSGRSGSKNCVRLAFDLLKAGGLKDLIGEDYSGIRKNWSEHHFMRDVIFLGIGIFVLVCSFIYLNWQVTRILERYRYDDIVSRYGIALFLLYPLVVPLFFLFIFPLLQLAISLFAVAALVIAAFTGKIGSDLTHDIVLKTLTPESLYELLLEASVKHPDLVRVEENETVDITLEPENSGGYKKWILLAGVGISGILAYKYRDSIQQKWHTFFKKEEISSELINTIEPSSLQFKN